MENKNKNKNRNEIIEKMITNQDVRIEVTNNSPYWFFLFYFSEYIKYEIADMHREMLEIIRNQENKLAVVTAFRGSGKSTLFTTLAPIWSVLGKLESKFVVITSQTKQQAKQHFSNLKKELEGNERLKRDLGPFEDRSEEWGQYGVYIPKYDARIIAVSSEQSFRGMRHGSHRPDLIICDDIDDLNSVKTKEARDKTYDWFKGDIMPAGDRNTKIMVVGTPLHRDDLINRLKEEIQENKVAGIYKEYPLLDSDGSCQWAGKYPTKEHIEKERRSVNDRRAWHREYLLTILPEKDQVIQKDWIQYYEKIPKDYEARYIAIDPAISKKDSADKTAMIGITVVGRKKDMQIFVHPNPVNERMDFPEAEMRAKRLSETMSQGSRIKILVENVAYQKSLPQRLDKEGYPSEAVSIGGKDKRARLSIIAPLIKRGDVLFPKKGTEELTNQLVDFGIEKYDDLADALTLAVTKALEENNKSKTKLIKGKINKIGSSRGKRPNRIKR